jgi:3-oxoacyl-[acyl-carrier-protein] synthase III
MLLSPHQRRDGPMDSAFSKSIGISAIATYEPTWVLGNDWFEGTIPRKFVQHTGTQSRPISWHDEVTMGIRAIDNLRRDSGCDLHDCAAMIFASPSFVPLNVARKYFDPPRAREERLMRAAHALGTQLDIPRCPVYALNWFCSGYAKALAVVRRQIVPMLGLGRDQFVLVVTASRISRITDYGCPQTGPLFGDMATATLLSRVDSPKYPVHFKLLHAYAEKQSAAGVFFDFALRENVLSPSLNGGKTRTSQRLVFRLDGMGIADVAPRAMSRSATGRCAICRAASSRDRHRASGDHEARTARDSRRSHQWPDQPSRQCQLLFDSLRAQADLESAGGIHRLPDRGRRSSRQSRSVARLYPAGDNSCSSPRGDRFVRLRHRTWRSRIRR